MMQQEAVQQEAGRNRQKQNETHLRFEARESGPSFLQTKRRFSPKYPETLAQSPAIYALGHHRRHHPSSPYNEIEADSIELELRTLDALSQPLNLDSSNTPDQEEIIKHLKRAHPD